MRGLYFILLLFLCLPNSAHAQESLSYAAEPDWIVDPGYPTEPTEATKGSAASNLLVSFQFFSGKTGPGEIYERRVFLVNEASALRALGTITAGYFEGRSRLVIHHARLVRGAETIDLLANDKRFATFRNEKNAGAGVIEGLVTAYLQIPDLRVGDRLDFSYSTITTLPLFTDQFEGEINFLSPGAADRVHYRVNWDRSRPLYWQRGSKIPEPVKGSVGSIDFLEGTADSQRFKGFDDSLPQRLATDWMFTATTRPSWQSLITTIQPIYAEAIAAQLPLDLQQRIIAIDTENPTLEAKAEAALRLVQQEIRYTGNFEGLGSHQPDSAAKVWTQRFGDCKGKSVLLAAILNRLGIDAVTALVSATKPGLVETSKPMVRAFDHVIVRATVNGKVYWLDGTRQSDRELATLEMPDFRFALPIAEGATLEKLPDANFPRPAESSMTEIDASEGFDVAAKVRSVITYRGESAYAFGMSLAALSDQQLEERRKDMIEESKTDSLKIEQVNFFNHPEKGEAGIEIIGSNALEWDDIGDFSELIVDDLKVGTDLAVERDDEATKKLPVAVSANHFESTVSIKLPLTGKKYTMAGSVFDRQVGPAHYVREAKLDGYNFVGRTLTRIVPTELPMADAEKFDQQTDKMFEDKIYIQADKAGAATKNSERAIVAAATAKASAGDLDGALADLASEIKRRPDAVSLVFSRAEILRNAGRPGVERELQKALLIDNSHLPSLELLAQLYADEGDIDSADAIATRIRAANPGSVWLKKWPKLRKEIENRQAQPAPEVAAP
jgi:Domain of Unknown Function with PDB structure (DUF3857)